MDISLHSFILAVGLVVICFIVWDGIKRARESRANPFEDELDYIDDDANILGDNMAPTDYDELEIADDLLQEHFLENIDELNIPISEAEQTSHKVLPIDDVMDPVEPNIDELSEPLIEEGICAEAEDKVSSVLTSDKELTGSTAIKQDAFVAVEKVAVKNPEAQVQQVSMQTDDEIETLMLHGQKSVPLLMEPVELGGQVDPNPPTQHELLLPEFVQQTLQDEPIVATKDEPEIETLSSILDSSLDSSLDSPLKNNLESSADTGITSNKTKPVGEYLSQREPAQEIIVINILKENQPLLSGRDLNRVFRACDMRHGEMEIFHRFEQSNAQGKIQFSVVNALKPGTFDLANMDKMETSGISLFMSLPGPIEAMEAFDAMAEVALVFARNFNASLFDESHSDLTPQTLEHYRQRIRDFLRKESARKDSSRKGNSRKETSRKDKSHASHKKAISRK